MRLVVYPHDLSIGGSQINAIDLAAGAKAAGHEVIVYGIPGPLVSYIADRGLRFIAAKPLPYRPAPSRICQLAALSRREGIELIHAYEWPSCLDAYFGASLVLGVPVLCTVLSMTVSPYVPRSVPLIMGTSELAQQARTTQRSDVWVIEPPIDVERDNPEVDGSAFRRNYGLTDLDFVVVSVSRLALDLKLDALVRAIDAIEMLGSSYPVKLVLVGDGPARGALEERARVVNHRLGRKAVLLVGETLDPRSAYAAADLVVGMGSSALRALAIGRPLVVQGEQAFSEVFEAETRDLFLNQGFYGVSDGSPDVSRLAGQIESLMLDPDRREALGKYGRLQVQERFSLRRAVELQLDIYAEVLSKAHRGNVLDAVRSAHLSLMLELVNHSPYRKRKKKLQTLQLLAAAESGSWPPVIPR